MEPELSQSLIPSPPPIFLDSVCVCICVNSFFFFSHCLSLYNGLSHGGENTRIGLTFLLYRKLKLCQTVLIICQSVACNVCELLNEFELGYIFITKNLYYSNQRS